MLDQQTFRKIGEFTRQYLMDSASRRAPVQAKAFPRSGEARWRHTLNVLKNAARIVEGEVYEEESSGVIRVAAVMHDIAMFDCDHSVHGEFGARIAREYLSALGFPESFVTSVRQAIAEHGVDFDTLSPEEMGDVFSIAGKVLIEADILDKLGASAVTAGLLTLGREGRLPHECRVELERGRVMERARYFKDYIWSTTAQRMAQERFGFFETYLARLADEFMDGKDPYLVDAMVDGEVGSDRRTDR
jgi:HD superfamily phosphodiesterase